MLYEGGNDPAGTSSQAPNPVNIINGDIVDDTKKEVSYHNDYNICNRKPVTAQNPS